jgi:hypothetical protein
VANQNFEQKRDGTLFFPPTPAKISSKNFMSTDAQFAADPLVAPLPTFVGLCVLGGSVANQKKGQISAGQTQFATAVNPY